MMLIWSLDKGVMLQLAHSTALKVTVWSLIINFFLFLPIDACTKVALHTYTSDLDSGVH